MYYRNEIIGGILIGIASALPLFLEGRVVGISGHASSILRPASKEGKTGFMFIAGLAVGVLLWSFGGGELPQKTDLKFGLGAWVVAGILIGFGSRLSGGCTSGHGICGLGRASVRSLVAVLLFMTAAAVTTFVTRVLP